MPVFDQGYQHWSGTLAGPAWRWLAITRRGVRTALENRWIRLFLLVTWLPVIALAFVLCLWGLLERQSELIDSIRPMLAFLDQPILAGPREYRQEIWTICFSYFLLTQLRLSMILILLAGPNLISQDLRYNALPLYFSRPLRRTDYVLGKLGIIVALLGMVIIVPAIFAYLLGLLFSLDLTIFRDTFRVLLASVGYGLIISISAGMLILALSSLSRNSRYVALFWIGIWFLSSMVAWILVSVERYERMHTAGRFAWAREDLLLQEIEAAKTDWRPLVSFTVNLTRLGEYLLGTDEAWHKLSQVRPAGQRGPFLAQVIDLQYPWYWSAAVLAALFGLSLCILNVTIKSLDRIK